MGRRKGTRYFIEGVKAYANAICDSIEKYNLDGFDIDYEPGYGHSGTLANYQTISPSGNNKMQVFIETLSARLRPTGRMLVMDGQRISYLQKLQNWLIITSIRHTGNQVLVL